MNEIHILIVEDEPIARNTLESLLQSCGFETIGVATAEAALVVADRESHPLFAFIDVDLPGMSGTELLQRLRETHPNIHTVLMTASNGDRVRRLFGNDVRLLRKPLDFSAVLNALSVAEH